MSTQSGFRNGGTAAVIGDGLESHRCLRQQPYRTQENHPASWPRNAVLVLDDGTICIRHIHLRRFEHWLAFCYVALEARTQVANTSAGTAATKPTGRVAHTRVSGMA